jgi:hypothetical protein
LKALWDQVTLLRAETADREGNALADNYHSLVLLLSLSSGSAAQQVTALQSLAQLSSEDLSTTIVRIDHLGDQNGSLPPVVFTVKGREVDWDRVMMLQSPDDLSPKGLSKAIVRIQFLGAQRGLLLPLMFTIKGRELDWKRRRAVPGLDSDDSVKTYTKPNTILPP